jgi:hypothetical protein
LGRFPLDLAQKRQPGRAAFAGHGHSVHAWPMLPLTCVRSSDAAQYPMPWAVLISAPSGFVVEPGIGGKGYGFVLDGGVYVHHRKRGTRYGSGFESSLYCQTQHKFTSLIPHPIPEPGHLARINRHFMPEIFFPQKYCQ